MLAQRWRACGRQRPTPHMCDRSSSAEVDIAAGREAGSVGLPFCLSADCTTAAVVGDASPAPLVPAPAAPSAAPLAAIVPIFPAPVLSAPPTTSSGISFNSIASTRRLLTSSNRSTCRLQCYEVTALTINVLTLATTTQQYTTYRQTTIYNRDRQ